MVTLKKWLLTKVGRDGIHYHIRADKAGSSLLEPIYTTETRAEVAIGEMCVSLRAFPSCLNGSQELIAWYVVVKKKWRCEVEMSWA